jgi:hypothetical protein
MTLRGSSARDFRRLMTDGRFLAADGRESATTAGIPESEGVPRALSPRWGFSLRSHFKTLSESEQGTSKVKEAVAIAELERFETSVSQWRSTSHHSRGPRQVRPSAIGGRWLHVGLHPARQRLRRVSLHAYPTVARRWRHHVQDAPQHAPPARRNLVSLLERAAPRWCAGSLDHFIRDFETTRTRFAGNRLLAILSSMQRPGFLNARNSLCFGSLRPGE